MGGHIDHEIVQPVVALDQHVLDGGRTGTGCGVPPRFWATSCSALVCSLRPTTRHTSCVPCCRCSRPAAKCCGRRSPSKPTSAGGAADLWDLDRLVARYRVVLAEARDSVDRGLRTHSDHSFAAFAAATLPLYETAASDADRIRFGPIRVDERRQSALAESAPLSLAAAFRVVPTVGCPLTQPVCMTGLELRGRDPRVL